MQRRQLWLVLLVETVFLVILAVWILIRLDRIFEPVSVLVALAIIVIGDVIAVLLMQGFAPTRIIFSAGENESKGQALKGFGSATVDASSWEAKNGRHAAMDRDPSTRATPSGSSRARG